MIFLYTASTLYHAIPNLRVKRILQVLDHSAIYVMIAGSYTPFCLVTLKGTTGTMLCIAVWSIALAGIILQPVLMKRAEWLNCLLYLLLGWCVVLVFEPLMAALPSAGICRRRRLLARRHFLSLGADPVQPRHLASLRAGRYCAPVLLGSLLRASRGRRLSSRRERDEKKRTPRGGAFFLSGSDVPIRPWP